MNILNPLSCLRIGMKQKMLVRGYSILADDSIEQDEGNVVGSLLHYYTRKILGPGMLLR